MADPVQGQKSSTKALLVTSRDTKWMPIQPFPKKTRMLIDLDLQPEQLLKFLSISNVKNHGEDQTAIDQIMKKTRRLSIYSFVSARRIDKEARELTTKLLNLPENVLYLEDDRRRQLQTNDILFRDCRED
ncbi:hypothetical protein RMATCC62417_17594 [Rhizopus microsporus]|nr:hypothetical protein RMATCC62417_17594 [Rhizopus microsporus]